MTLRVHFLDVGQGDSTFIEFPGGKTMLVDACFSSENLLDYVVSRLSKEKGETKPRLDYLVITHPHDDHIRGIGLLGEKVKVMNVWESGHRLFVPKDDPKYKNYHDMLDLIQAVKKRDGGVRVLTASSTSFSGGVDDAVEWTCFSPSRSYVESEHPSEHDIHTQCIVLKLQFGTFSILFTGDSNWESWKERIVPNYSNTIDSDAPNLLKSTILHASHHGSISFFGESEDAEDLYVDGLQKIAPDVTIVSVGDNTYGHPHEKAVSLYREHTFRRSSHQVMQTRELRTLVLEVDENGDYSIMPWFHKHLREVGGKMAPRKSLAIEAAPGPWSDGRYPKGVSITFSVTSSTRNGAATIAQYTWEVQNNGVASDGRIHDWYMGQASTSPTYMNTTAYTGEHNLVCRAYDSQGLILGAALIPVRVRD